MPDLAGVEVEDVDQRACSYDCWLDQCSQSLRILVEQQEHVGPDGDFRGVSLVSFVREVADDNNDNADMGLGTRRVEIIHWTGNVPGITGRVVRMDDQNRLKVPVPVGENRVPIAFGGNSASIIWRDTGVKVVKAQWKKNQNQSTMPDHLLRLLDMFREAEGDSRATSPTKCFVCGDIDSKYLPIKQATRCCLCLMSSHEKCIDNIKQQLQLAIDSETSSLESSGAVGVLPIRVVPNFTMPSCFHHPRQ